MRKPLIILFLFIFIITSNTFTVKPARANFAGCGANPGTLVEVLTKSVSTLYNVFPIRIAGISIGAGANLEDYVGCGGIPICVCWKGIPPIPRIGIKVSFWEPIAVVETIKSPWCFPSLGVQMPISISKMSAGTEAGWAERKKVSKTTFAQTHYIKYPTFALLNLLTDFVCLSFLNGLDVGYITEVDPLWQNDTLAFVLNPEAAVFGNPVTQFACMADSTAAAAGFSLDPLFWCMGSWGSSYPLTGNISSVGYTQANAGEVARLLYKMHREMLLWGSVGCQAMCQMYPMPIWRKSQYSIFPLYPVLFPFRFAIGRTGLMWSEAQNPPIPIRNDNFAWAIYRKRDCCAF
jgi:conjugal transfer pilus assembly protein TraU